MEKIKAKQKTNKELLRRLYSGELAAIYIKM